MNSEQYNKYPYYIIPARLGSKGLPFKNRTLFKKTADLIPKSSYNFTIVSTDDPEIIRMAKEYGFLIDVRPSELSQDETSMKDVIKHIITKFQLEEKDNIILLYLTYPERTLNDIANAYIYFLNHLITDSTESLLCRMEIDKSPYLYLKENGIYGTQLEKHNLYRRQDYPICFEISHYLSIFQAGAINKLNNNLYNERTVFYKIDRKIDVDTKKDLDNFTDGPTNN